jgi:E3 ubiquitin-protein ligase UBR4
LVPIHFHCHDHLKARDPDQEWQQALVINCEAPCNAIFPIPDHEHVRADAYRVTLVHFYARFGNPAVASVVRDITTLLIGMADGRTIGNKFALLPLLVYAGHTLLEESAEARGAMERRMMSILRGAVSDSCDGLGLSLLVLTADEWLHVEFALLRVIVRHTHVDMQADDGALFSKLKHVLFAWAVVHDVHMSMLANVGDTPVKDDGDGILVIPSHFNAQWVQKFMAEVEANPKKVSDDWKGNAAKWEENLAKAVTLDALLAVWEETPGEGPPKDWIRSCLL